MSKLNIKESFLKKNRLKLFAVAGSVIIASSVVGCNINKKTEVEKLGEIIDEIPADTLEKEVADYILVYDELEKRGYTNNNKRSEGELLSANDIDALIKQSETLSNEQTNRILFEQGGLIKNYLDGSKQEIYNNYKALLKEYAIEKLRLIDVTSITFKRSYEGAASPYRYSYEAKTSTKTILGEINDFDIRNRVDDMIKHEESKNTIENLSEMINDSVDYMNKTKQITIQ